MSHLTTANLKDLLACAQVVSMTAQDLMPPQRLLIAQAMANCDLEISERIKAETPPAAAAATKI